MATLSVGLCSFKCSAPRAQVLCCNYGGDYWEKHNGTIGAPDSDYDIFEDATLYDCIAWDGIAFFCHIIRQVVTWTYLTGMIEYDNVKVDQPSNPKQSINTDSDQGC